METFTDNARAVKGLAARLAMDANLGMGFVSVTSDIPAVLRALEERPRHGEPAPRRAAPAAVSAAASVRAVSSENMAAPYSAVPPPAARVPAAAAPSPGVHSPAPDGFSLVPFVAAPVNAEKEALLAELRNECLVCRACDLAERRNSVVWGEGSLDAQVMFVGEGPGRDEDAEGRPFVGRSGRLLTDIIEKGMKIPRHGVYIANVVKCRPPGNRDPKPDEVAACSRYLAKQIEVVAPRVLVAVGNVAGRALLGLGPDASGLRGCWRECRGLPLRVIYHPSYLLRQRRAEGGKTKADAITWEDIQEVMRKL